VTQVEAICGKGQLDAHHRVNRDMLQIALMVRALALVEGMEKRLRRQ
jgi:hypothetical protein